ncbi:UDP-glycosyltransferase 79A6 [Glycine soja]|nr:UDP-glycosyltransferase 79A6 [Glycine soja]
MSEDGDFKQEDILKAVKTIMVEDDEEPGKRIKENHMKWKEFLSRFRNSEQIHH